MNDFVDSHGRRPTDYLKDETRPEKLVLEMQVDGEENKDGFESRKIKVEQKIAKMSELVAALKIQLAERYGKDEEVSQRINELELHIMELRDEYDKLVTSLSEPVVFDEEGVEIED